MISGSDAREVLYASLHFHELFKKTLYALTPSQIATKTQVSVAVALFVHKSMSMSELSERIGIAPEQATRATKALKECGIVACERNPANRREVIASLTDAGTEIFEQQLDSASAVLRDKLGVLDQDEVDALVEAARTAKSILAKTAFQSIVPEG